MGTLKVNVRKRRHRHKQAWLASALLLAIVLVVVAVSFLQRGDNGISPSPVETSDPLALVQPTPDSREAVSLPVSNILQEPELPNGCEITSLAIVLKYWGYAIDKCTLSDTYLPKSNFYRINDVLYGANPETVYPGNPRTSDGFYCYPAPIVEAANQYLTDMHADLKAYDISGSSLEELKQQLRAGHPVLVWVTLDGSAPVLYDDYYWILDGTDTVYTPYRNAHCIVLTGYTQDGRLQVCNPLSETDTYWEEQTFLTSYQGMGQRAVVIY